MRTIRVILFAMIATLSVSAQSTTSCNWAKETVIKCFSANIILSGSELKTQCEEPIKKYINLYLERSCGRFTPRIHAGQDIRKISLQQAFDHMKKAAWLLNQELRGELSLEDQIEHEFNGLSL